MITLFERLHCHITLQDTKYLQLKGTKQLQCMIDNFCLFIRPYQRHSVLHVYWLLHVLTTVKRCVRTNNLSLSIKACRVDPLLLDGCWFIWLIFQCALLLPLVAPLDTTVPVENNPPRLPPKIPAVLMFFHDCVTM